MRNPYPAVDWRGLTALMNSWSAILRRLDGAIPNCRILAGGNGVALALRRDVWNHDWFRNGDRDAFSIQLGDDAFAAPPLGLGIRQVPSAL